MGYEVLNDLQGNVVVITDDNLNRSYDLERFGRVISIPPGEASKTRETKAAIEDELLQSYGRDLTIVAFGGGVVGDLAGYVAATFNRGVPFIQVPTSLLAMVDASIGGKNGVNTEQGKNLIGTFYEPKRIITDISLLDTLPDVEFRNGLAEVIKIATTSDKQFFDSLDKNIDDILAKDKEALSYMVDQSIALKQEVVDKDPYESGYRQILNFGHTIGHALEAYHDYKMKHGYCVSIGMNVEAAISQIQGHLTKDDRYRIVSLLAKALPVTLGSEDEDVLLTKMKHDKKSRNQVPRFILLKGIGRVKQDDGYSYEVDGSVIREAIRMCR